ncbi:Phage protein [Yersinia phage fPS-86]|uniref:Phage protein n=1 Tax=Yersinia phage fPS-86 TaxID=2052757 RepID=A0A2D0PDV8_9CAUD|nr:Phage protein [Yersinia phage fPS-86]
MCWSPKIKTPSVDTNQIRAVDPAPLTEEPKGILFGGDDEKTTNDSGESTSGRKSLKVAKDNSVSNYKSGDAPKAVSPKSAIRKSFTPKR